MAKKTEKSSVDRCKCGCCKDGVCNMCSDCGHCKTGKGAICPDCNCCKINK